MKCHVYFDGSLFKTQASNIAQLGQELRQQGFYNDLLIIFDDKKVYIGNEETTQIYGRLNIFRASFIVREIEDSIRLKQSVEIKQLEIQRLERQLKTAQESLQNDLLEAMTIHELEIQQLKQNIDQLQEQEIVNTNKLENLRKQNYELKYLVARNKDLLQHSEKDLQEIAKQNVFRDLSDQNLKLKTDILKLKNELQSLQDKSVIIKKKVDIENHNYKTLLEQYNKTEQIRNEKDEQVKELRQKISQLQNQCSLLEFELQQPKGPSQTSIIRIQTIQNDLNKKIESLDGQLFQEKIKHAEVSAKYDLQRDDNFKLNKEIVELKQNCENIKRVMDQKKEEIDKLQDQRSMLEADMRSKQEQIQQYEINAQNQEKKIQQVKQKSERIVEQLRGQIKECENTIKSQQEQINLKDNLIKQYEQQLQELKQKDSSPEDVERLQYKLESEQQQKEKLEQSLQNARKQLELNKGFLVECIFVNDVVKEIDNENQNIEQQIRRNKQILDEELAEKKRAIQEKKNFKKQQQEQAQKLKEEQEAKLRSKLEADLRKRCKELSEMQVCFIIDTTHSMKPYFDQALQCIKECVQTINSKMNRQVQWAIVTYKDFDYNKKYQYLEFTKNQEELVNFGKLITCEGGADTAEDLDGALQIVLDQDKIKWTQAVKLCILITDSPCHGKDFSTISSDDYPNSDIRPSLKRLFDQEISLVGIKLNPIGYADCLTTQMYQQFENIYKQNNKEEHLLVFDLQKQQTQNLWKDFASTISQATFRVATAIKATKSKLKDDNKVGNMQALIQILKNPKQFDQDIFNKPRNVDLEVNLIELKPDIKDDLITLKEPKIHLIQVKSLMKWQCRMSSKPFAQGQNKSVYVMKKQNNNDEVYVLKGQLNGSAYPTLDDANRQCFSHLVAKFLMEEFKKQLQFKKKSFLEISYSDLLILKESNNQYWIAERYFEGAFEKYNNNYGYINPDQSDLNNFAQAFSQFTLFYCNNYQIVLDVQGVGIHWTDPAILTRNGTFYKICLGEFDETDKGEEGMSMYLTNKEIDVFKDIGNKYLL